MGGWAGRAAGVLMSKGERLLFERNQPRGLSRAESWPSTPNVGGLPGPAAVNRQPYDLVRVCVCGQGGG